MAVVDETKRLARAKWSRPRTASPAPRTCELAALALLALLLLARVLGGHLAVPAVRPAAAC
jgi:hypothetical protein